MSKEKKNNNTSKKKQVANIKSKDTNKKELTSKTNLKPKKEVIEEITLEEEEEFFEEEIEEVKPKKEKKEKVKKDKPKKEPKKEIKKEVKEEKKKEKTSIEKIEKLAKNKKKVSKNSNNTKEILSYIDKNRFTIYGFLAGAVITVLIVIIIWPNRIATLKDGTQNVATIKGKNYTADALYEKMKDHYSVNQLLDMIDNDILTKMYKEDKAMKKEIESNAEYYLNMYKQYYGYTQEQFLENNGFKDYDAFLEYLKLDYRRNKYLETYIKDNITDDEIDKYYKDNVFGDINVQHILVETKSDDNSSDDKSSNKLSDDDAKKLAKEIIKKINDGTSWKDIQKEYKDKVTYEDLGYQGWDANLEEAFMTALKGMKNDSYSKEPVKTSYGYHVIYRIDQKDAPKLKDVKDTIIKNIISDKKNKDTNLQNKALIKLRSDNNLDFKDTVLNKKYESYKKQYQ